jgi:hypothetical protein
VSPKTPEKTAFSLPATTLPLVAGPPQFSLPERSAFFEKLSPSDKNEFIMKYPG